MVVIDTSFQKLNSLLKKSITLKELEDVLADMGMELDDSQGDEIKVEITAERVDLITTQGLARAINCYKQFVPEYQEIKTNPSKYTHVVDPQVKKYRPFTRSFIVKGISLNDQDIKLIMRVQEKIHDTFGRKRKKVSIGIYDLDQISFPVTYTVKKPSEISFIPLDETKVATATQILETHPKGKEYKHLLEGFNKYPLQIDAKNNILSMPPIINSADLGNVNTSTTNLFVESTGSDEKALDEVMNILSTMFYDLKGKIFQVAIQEKNKKTSCPALQTSTREVSVAFINKVIGLSLTPKQAIPLLKKMQYRIESTKGDKIKVIVPSVKTDVWHPIDIADDVARAYGYNNITPTLPDISTIGGMLPLNILAEDVSNFLVGLNLIEVKTFALTNHNNQFEKMNSQPVPHITLGKNTTDKELSMVRSHLMPEVIKSLASNRHRSFPQNIFEVGTVVVPDLEADVKAKNQEKLVCLICDEQADFTKIKQVLDQLASFLDIEIKVKETNHPSYIQGRVADIYFKSNKIGIIGEIHPICLENFGLVTPLSAFELNIEMIQESKSK